ncbi:MAG: hypothetical protein ACRECQ_11460, partial [Burkholderiaceae bacterium]
MIQATVNGAGNVTWSNPAMIAFVRSGNYVMGLGYESGSNVFGFGQATTAPTRFSPSFLNVNSSGSVGLGTTNPATKLDVVSGQIRSITGTYATVDFNEYNSSGSDRYWRLAAFNRTNGAQAHIDGNFSRVDGQSHLRCKVNANGGSPGYNVVSEVIGNGIDNGRVQLYNNTATSQLEVDVFARSYTAAQFRLRYDASQLLALNLMPNWTTTAPTTSGTFVLVHDTTVNAGTHLSSTGLGVFRVNPSYALDVSGQVRANRGSVGVAHIAMGNATSFVSTFVNSGTGNAVMSGSNAALRLGLTGDVDGNTFQEYMRVH